MIGIRVLSAGECYGHSTGDGEGGPDVVGAMGAGNGVGGLPRNGVVVAAAGSGPPITEQTRVVALVSRVRPVAGGPGLEGGAGSPGESDVRVCGRRPTAGVS